MGEHNPDGRKRRRIAPINHTLAPSTAYPQLENAEPSSAYNAPSQAPLGNWDYLAKWQAEDTSIVELEDLGEDDHYSHVDNYLSEVMEEMDHESEDQDDSPAEDSTPRPSKLSSDRVTEIINECIEVYTNAWEPGKGETEHKYETGESEALVVYDTVAMRKEAQAAGRQDVLVEKYQLEAEYYRQRLDRLCDEISKDPGDAVAGVKMKCRNLEVTVELFERANWLASIYDASSDADSGNELRDGDSVVSNNALLPATQLFGRLQGRSSPFEVIDLGTPSDSSDPETDHEVLKDSSAMPARSNERRGHGRQTHSLVPEPISADIVEIPSPVASAVVFTTMRPGTPLGSAPEHASVATVSRWSWPQLTDTQDRKRVVSKAICDLSSTQREMIRQRLQNVGRANMIREIPACVDMLLCGDARMPGVLPQDLPKIVTFTKLFLCWWFCGNYLSEDLSKLQLEKLARCLRRDSADPTTFCDYVSTVFSTTFSHAALSNPMQPSQAEIIELSDDDEPLPQPLQR
ncbi:uncharacterized protein EKO05_0003030 [Ascochyta rabiei]|nr:uncharacterized protein EKO05_0003030 [Ascochyta rabiei]UPX12485.1 hypothetical protein EKO05_0003030 [Ascochyta rabiei]